MDRRLELQNLLETITPHVYYQPPATVKMEFPCIVYKKAVNSYTGHGGVEYADGSIYFYKQKWDIQVIDRKTDSDICSEVEKRLY